MKKHMCLVCGYVYDEGIGDKSQHIEPKTLFNNLPDDWVCPDCHVSKNNFEELEF